MGLKPWREINELFDRAMPYSRDYPPFENYNFKIGDDKYYVHFNKYSDADMREVSFTKDLSAEKDTDLRLSKAPTEILNTGNAVPVLSTVIAIMKDYADRHPDVNRFEFAALEPSRKKLYSAMITKLLSTKMTDWRVKHRQNFNNAFIWELERK